MPPARPAHAHKRNPSKTGPAARCKRTGIVDGTGPGVATACAAAFSAGFRVDHQRRKRAQRETWGCHELSKASSSLTSTRPASRCGGEAARPPRAAPAAAAGLFKGGGSTDRRPGSIWATAAQSLPNAAPPGRADGAVDRGLHGPTTSFPEVSRITSPTMVTVAPSNKAHSRNSKALPDVPRSPHEPKLGGASAADGARCARMKLCHAGGAEAKAWLCACNPSVMSNNEVSRPFTVRNNSKHPTSNKKSLCAARYASGGEQTPS
mmetsp:Transcript_129474/g.374991  ORF Transcript_129474/g.374991 Transcript_129474/m.374991 type:complete len:264 (-) Transcript_129474:1229-2020(-)